MQIQSLAQQRAIPLTSIVSGSISSERVSLPVPRSQALYARFKHISGRPDPSGGGHSISKLRSLDNLIDRLVKLKEMKAAEPPSSGEIKGLSNESLDVMIQDLSAKLHRAYIKSESNPFLNPGPAAGLVADISL